MFRNSILMFAEIALSLSTFHRPGEMTIDVTLTLSATKRAIFKEVYHWDFRSTLCIIILSQLRHRLHNKTERDARFSLHLLVNGSFQSRRSDKPGATLPLVYRYLRHGGWRWKLLSHVKCLIFTRYTSSALLLIQVCCWPRQLVCIDIVLTCHCSFRL